jgi:hypothetical protein
MDRATATGADYAAYIAAGVALLSAIGSWVASWRSNKNSRAQLVLQLQHAADQRDRDREMSLKRDVFLPAVEALIRSQGILGKTINPEFELPELGQQLMADQAIMAKIHLVGTEKTVTALMTFMNQLMPAYLELSTMRIPLVVCRNAIDAEQSVIDRSNALQQQNIELMRQFNIAGKSDQAEWERLRGLFDAEQDTYRQHTERKAELWEEYNAHMRRAFTRMTELAQTTSSLIPHAVLAAREEIELPIDQAKYQKLFGDQPKIVQQVMQQFMDKTMPSPSRSSDSSPP